MNILKRKLKILKINIFSKNFKYNKIFYINLTFKNPSENQYFIEFDYSSNTAINKLIRIVNLCTSYTLLNCLTFDVKIIFHDEFLYDIIHKNEKIDLSNKSYFFTIENKIILY